MLEYYKILIITIVAFCSGCSGSDKLEPALDDMLSIEVREVSKDAENIEFEVIIKNSSKDKIEISSEGDTYPISLVSVLEIDGKSVVVNDFPSSFSIDSRKSKSHRFSLKIGDLDETLDLERIQFYMGVIRWKIGENSKWREEVEGICLETK